RRMAIRARLPGGREGGAAAGGSHAAPSGPPAPALASGVGGCRPTRCQLLAHRTGRRRGGPERAKHPAYRRGVQFLLKTQRSDGSWFVESRSLPVQPYFESGFPHGRSQFIPCAATGWATIALGLTAPPSRR